VLLSLDKKLFEMERIKISVQKKGRISDQVLEEMKQMIYERKWVSGERLPSEQALCEMFGVSRVTIRSALSNLKALNLITTRLGDGSYVKHLDARARINDLIPVVYLEDDLKSILEFRMEIESGTCALAAQRATKKDVAYLKQLLKEMLALQGDLDALCVADLEFHYAIARMSQNSLIIKTYEVIGDIYAHHMKRMVSEMGGDLGVYYHTEIVKAIEEHNVSHARKVMYEHIQKNMEFFTEKEKIPRRSVFLSGTQFGKEAKA